MSAQRPGVHSPGEAAGECLGSPKHQVDIVVPVYNEQSGLEQSVRRLHEFLSRDEFAFTWRVVIADNASTDDTLRIARSLAAELPHLDVLHLDEKGRGRALRAAWLASDAEVVSYMDVDLSTDLRALLPLVAPLVSGHSDLAIGTRLAPESRVSRRSGREFVSRAYNAIVHTVLQARFSDAQCGFKAVRAETARELLPGVRDQAWFFDTELLVLAERQGLRIHEVPVDWIDDPDSRVDIVPTATADLAGVARLFASGQIGRFIGIGIASTAAYAAIFLALRPSLGAGMANLVALAITAVGNTAANRLITFGVRGREGLVRQQLQGAVVFVLTLALTSGALGVLHKLIHSPPHGVELTVLIVASVCATVTRYLALRSWVFSPRRPPPALVKAAPERP